MTDGGTPTPLLVPLADRRVKKIIVDGIVYAHAFKLPGEPPFDPQLCLCQRLRPAPGETLCPLCIEREARHA